MKQKISTSETNIFLISLILILSIGCSNLAERNNKSSDELQNEENQKTGNETCNCNLTLEEIVSDNKLIMKQINGIKELESKKTKVISFAEYESVFKMRENLIFLFKKDEKLIKCLKECEDLHQELSEYGIMSYSEKNENPGFYRDAFPESIADRVVLTLEDLVRDKKLIMEQLNNVKKTKANSPKIKSIAEVEKALKMRDSLIVLLQNDEKFNNFMGGYTIWQKLKNELKALGITIIQAEGLFYNIIKGPFLDNVIEKVADEPYIIRNRIQNLFGETMSGEYPYGNIQEEMEIVFLSEKMLSNYPDHEYNKEIMEIFSNALNTLTNIHKYTGKLVTSDNEFVGYEERYLIGNYNSDYYPCITDTLNQKDYIKKYPNSKFTKVIKNILANISSLSYDGSNVLYIVEVPPLNSNSIFIDENLKREFNNLPKEIAEQNDCFKYMWLGIDIPHNLYLGNNIDITAYRFFDKKDPAEKSLKTIQKIIPSAKLVEYQLNSSTEK